MTPQEARIYLASIGFPIFANAEKDQYDIISEKSGRFIRVSGYVLIQMALDHHKFSPISSKINQP